VVKLTDFMARSAIIPEVKATTKEDVIREMVASLRDGGLIKGSEYDNIVKAILKREELGSTGIGNGVAVPHTKHPSIEKLVGAVALSREGVDFASLDGERVHILFLLISPPDQPGDHLRALEKIARHLRDERFCRFLKQAKSTESIWELLDEADQNKLGG